MFGDALTDPVRRVVATRWLPPLASEIRVTTSSLGRDVVLLGAAALLLSNELGIA